MPSDPASAHTYLIETLGCKANLYDSQRLAETLQAIGFRQAQAGEHPALCVVNTCTVTAVADRKSRQHVARLAREHPDARLFVTGCYATAAPDELGAIPGVDGVYGREEWPALIEAANGAPVPDAADMLAGDFGICAFGGRARAFLKIQEGCDSFCSYCILPYIRGRPRSRPLREVAAEAARLAAEGFAEIVLTGIHLGLYGTDQPGRPTLADAVRAVAGTDGVARVRLSSLRPNEVDDELLDAMAHPAVCAHLHLPLQSGDDAVLRRMNRRYTTAEFLRCVGRARERLDRPAITTDVIAGFPGESEAEFANTLATCRAARFSRLHVFPFSPRSGTPAAEMPDRPGVEAVRERSHRLRKLGSEMAAEWAAGFVGQSVRVLFEQCSAAGQLTGYTDRYVRVAAEGDPDMIGRTATVFCAASQGASLVGRIGG